MNASDDRPWKFAVTLVNERSGQQYTVIVELTDDERADAIEHTPFEMQQEEGWRPLVNLFASARALAGLPEDAWSVPYSEITRIRFLH